MWFCLPDTPHCELRTGKNNVLHGYNGISVSKYLLNETMIDPDTESLEMRGDQGVAATGLDSEGSQSSVLPSPSSPN